MPGTNPPPADRAQDRPGSPSSPDYVAGPARGLCAGRLYLGRGGIQGRPGSQAMVIGQGSETLCNQVKSERYPWCRTHSQLAAKNAVRNAGRAIEVWGAYRQAR